MGHNTKPQVKFHAANAYSSDWPAARPTGAASGAGSPNIFTAPAPAVPTGDGHAGRALPEPTARSIEKVEDLSYRRLSKGTARLPRELLQVAGGLTTREGNPNPLAFIMARAAVVDRRQRRAKTDAIAYHDGRRIVERVAGTHIKAIESHAADHWERNLKRMPPPGERQTDERFQRLYWRFHNAVRRKLRGQSNVLKDTGPALPSTDKLDRDKSGRRWQASKRLSDCPTGGAPLDVVQCTGEDVERRAQGGPAFADTDVGRELERITARQRELHTEFTHVHGKSHTKQGYYAALDWQHISRHRAAEGVHGEAYTTAGAYRPDEIGRPGKKACRVPWICFDLDSKGPNGKRSLRAAFNDAGRLVELLLQRGADAEAIQVVLTGGDGLHVRLADGAVGCPIYASERHAYRRLCQFTDRLLAGKPALQEAVDRSTLHPGHMVRTAGSVHPKTGARAVAFTASEFRSFHPGYCCELAAPQRPHSAHSFTEPSTAPLSSTLAFLLYTPAPRTARPQGSDGYCLSLGKALPEKVAMRLRRGVEESDHWGPSCDWANAPPGRNGAACQLARHIFATGEARTVRAGREAVERWNRRNSPALPVGELRRAVASAWRYVNGSAA